MILETQILENVIGLLNNKSDASPPFFAPVTIGGLTSKNGISAEIAPGYSKSDYLAGGSLLRMPVLILIKHENHRTAMETAFMLANVVRNANLPLHESIAGISMGSGPEFVQRNGTDYIYSLILNIDYLCRAGNGNTPLHGDVH